MNEMRRDPITRKWVIMDHTFPEEAVQKLLDGVNKDAKKIKAPQSCEFCPGNEGATAVTILEYKNKKFEYRVQSPDWQIRVFPSKSPVFRVEGQLNRRLVSMYDVMDALGAHEVIVEHREHLDWDQMSRREVADIIATYVERINDLSKDERFGHLFIFKNYGPSAGSRIQHPHSTLIASPSVPERIRRELDFTRRHFQMKERCLFCDIASEELRRKESKYSGLVKAYENFVNISPFFASHPFETWILPRRHSSNFRNLESARFEEVATALQENLQAVKAIVGPLSYTLLLMTRPNKVWGGERDYWTTIDEDYHWHFKFIPRFPRVSGFHRSFSAGTGYMMNQVPPEYAARLLREQLAQESK